MNPIQIIFPTENLLAIPGYFDMEGPVIYCVDELYESYYVLRRPGLPPLSHPWPGPLEEICPEAKWIRSQGTEVG